MALSLTPEMELFIQIKNQIEGSADLITVVGATPKVHYWKQAADTEYPYFVYNLTNTQSFDKLVYTGRVEIGIWFYSTNALKAFQCEGIISELFHEKFITGTNLVHCRLWHDYEGRKETEQKDLVVDKQVVCIEICFEARWCTQSRITSAVYPL